MNMATAANDVYFFTEEVLGLDLMDFHRNWLYNFTHYHRNVTICSRDHGKTNPRWITRCPLPLLSRSLAQETSQQETPYLPGESGEPHWLLEDRRTIANRHRPRGLFPADKDYSGWAKRGAEGNCFSLSRRRPSGRICRHKFRTKIHQRQKTNLHHRLQKNMNPYIRKIYRSFSQVFRLAQEAVQGSPSLVALWPIFADSLHQNDPTEPLQLPVHHRTVVLTDYL